MSESAKDIEELFRFDPFTDDGSDDSGYDAAAPSSGKELDDEYADGAGDAGSQQADTDDSGKSEDAAAAAEGAEDQQKPDESGEPAAGKGKDEKDEELENLKEQLRQQSAQMQELQKQLSSKDEGQQEEAGKQDDTVPSYQFQIPDQIVNGLASEDENERRNAVSALVSGIGQSVHAQMQQQFREEMEKRIQRFQQESSQTSEQTTQAERIKQDYFGQYPRHDNDLIRPLVRTKSQEVLKEWGVREWTPRVRDEIAKRVDADLRKAGFSGEPADSGKETQQRGNGAAAPPHMRRSGARPAGSAGGPNSSHDIENTLFG
jgi:hypothetical protein